MSIEVRSTQSGDGDRKATGRSSGSSTPPPDDVSMTADGEPLERRALLNSARLTAALLISWTLSLVGRFLLPRVLGTEQFGELAFIEGVAVLAMAATGFGVDGFILREVAIDNKRTRLFARPLRRIQYSAGVLTTAALAITFAVTSGREQAMIALVFGLGQMAIVLGRIDAAYLQAAHDVRAETSATIVTKAIWFALLIGCLGAGIELMALPIAVVVSEFVRASWLRRAMHQRYGQLRRGRLRNGVDVLVGALPYFINTLNVVFLGYSVRVIVGLLSSDEAVGLLATAEVAIAVPMLLTPIIGQISLPMLSSLASRSRRLMWRRASQIVDGISVPVTAGSVLLFALSDELMVLAFGDEYADAGLAFGLLALAVPATYFTQIVGAALMAAGREWQNTRINLYTMLLVAVTTAVILSVLSDASAGTATAWAAATLLVGEYITVLALLWVQPLPPLRRSTSASLVVLTVTAFGIAIIGRDINDPAWLALVSVAVLTALVTLPRALNDVLSILGRGKGADADADADADDDDAAAGGGPTPAVPRSSGRSRSSRTGLIDHADADLDRSADVDAEWNDDDGYDQGFAASSGLKDDPDLDDEYLDDEGPDDDDWNDDVTDAIDEARDLDEDAEFDDDWDDEHDLAVDVDEDVDDVDGFVDDQDLDDPDDLDETTSGDDLVNPDTLGESTEKSRVFHTARALQSPETTGGHMDLMAAPHEGDASTAGGSDGQTSESTTRRMERSRTRASAVDETVGRITVIRPPELDEEASLFSVTPLRRWSRYIWQAVKSHKFVWTLVFVPVLLLVGMFLASSPPNYQTSATVLLGGDETIGGVEGGSFIASRQASQVILRRDSVDRMIDEIGLVDNRPEAPFFGRLQEQIFGASEGEALEDEIRDQLRQSIFVSGNEVEATIDIVVLWPDAQQAVDIAELSYQIFLEDRTRAEVEPRERQVEILTARAAQASAEFQALVEDSDLAPGDGGATGSQIEIASSAARDAIAELNAAQVAVDEARIGVPIRYALNSAPELPKQPLAGNLVLYVATMIMALMVATGAAFWLERPRGRVVTAWQLERLGRPIVTTPALDSAR